MQDIKNGLKIKNENIINYESEINLENIFSVLEFSTLRCIYNIVATTNKPKSYLPFLPKEIDPTYSNDIFWLRYKVDIGFDLSEVEVNISQNEINIKLPKAKILNIPELDIDSINNNDYEFVIADFEHVLKIDNDKILASTHIGENEQKVAIKKANENIKEEINKNNEIFDMAEKRLKKMIKAYVDTINLMFHKKYIIKWI